MMSSNPKIRVLLVEDSRLLAEQILELLQMIPCADALGVVATEREAIDTAMGVTPDLIILDLHLKQGTGFGVLKALTAAHRLPTVIVLTNYALPQYREQALSLGAHYFLDKSGDFDRLPTIIRQLSDARGTACN
jgi:two-component system OmpR family response regulator